MEVVFHGGEGESDDCVESRIKARNCPLDVIYDIH